MTGDDSMVTLIAMGGGKDLVQPSEFLINSSVLLGLLLKHLHLSIPGIPWYGLSHLLVFSASILCFVFLILDGPLDWEKSLLLALFPFEFFHYFIHFEFTITAFWAALAGLFLLLDSTRKGRGWPFFLAAGFLFFAASLFRFQSLELVLAAAFPFVIFECFQMKPSQRKRILVFTALLTVLLIPSLFLNQRYYEGNPEWAGLRPYLSSYLNLVEYRRINAIPIFPSILASAGWNYLDLTLFENWFWQGPQFGIEKLKTLLQNAGPLYSHKGLGWVSFFQTDFIPVRVLVLCLFLFFTQVKKYLLEAFNFIGVILCLSWAFFIFEKLFPGSFGRSFSYLSILGLYYSFPEQAPLLKKNSLRWIGWGLLALWIIVSSGVLRSEWIHNQADIAFEKKIESDIRILAPQRDQLYVMWATLGGFPTDRLSVFGNYDLFKEFPIYPLTWEQTHLPPKPF